MSTEVTETGSRFRLSVALIGLALGVAVFVLATQARSIWSTKTGPQVRPVPAAVVLSANADVRKGGHITIGCRRPKYGCHDGHRTSSHTPIACRRPKYGCQQSGRTTAERP
jgi:hypothetical protein